MTNCSVLIVDDDKVDRYILKRLLKQTEIVSKIYEFDNGKSGLDFLENYNENRILHGDGFPPMIIFLDVNMPLMNGFEFLEGFKSASKVHDLGSSIIFMFSSSQRESDKELAFSYDFVKSYIVKMPSDADILKNKILEVIAES